MNITLLTFLLTILSIVVMFTLNHFLHLYDVRLYRSLRERERTILMMTAWSFLYLLYAISFGTVFLPLIIIGIGICLVWMWFFFMDTSISLVDIKDKIILFSITVIALIGTFFGIRYLFLFGITPIDSDDLLGDLRNSSPLCQRGWYDTGECNKVAIELRYTKEGDNYHVCQECADREDRIKLGLETAPEL